MVMVFVSLILGGLIGYFKFIPEPLEKHLGSLTTLGLVILLFSMGIMIGTDERIFSMITTISLQAFLLAAGAVLGSVAAVRFVSNYLTGSKRQGGEL